MKHPDNLQDTLSINLQYKNGSIGNINYFANGAKDLSKEYVEVYQSGMTAIIDNFKELSVLSKEKTSRKKLLNQDKGQKQEVKLFIDSIRNNITGPIPYNEIYSTSLVTLKVIESIRSGQVCTISE
jgi:predicted dehydrogenase